MPAPNRDQSPRPISALSPWRRLLVLPALAVAACASPPKAAPEPASAPEEQAPTTLINGEPVPGALDSPVAWNPDVNKDQRKIGYVLAELDQRLRTWHGLVLSGSDARDAHQINVIEASIAHDASKHQSDLIDQLVTGPPNNRRVAAAALGFSGSTLALGPLLAALGDRDEEVVANALLSLGTLRDPATPLTSIADLMSEHTSPTVRVNAGRALRALLARREDPAERDAVRTAARRGVADSEPAARMNALLLLAELVDRESFDTVALALNDDVPLVARAASRSVAFLGSTEAQLFGRAARVLAASLLRVDKTAVRPAVLGDLQRLGQRNYGDDTDAWLEWANRLP